MPDEQAREFAAIIARRRQVVGMLVAEGNRLETAVPPVRKRIGAHRVREKGRIAWPTARASAVSAIQAQSGNRGARSPGPLHQANFRYRTACFDLLVSAGCEAP